MNSPPSLPSPRPPPPPPHTHHIAFLLGERRPTRVLHMALEWLKLCASGETGAAQEMSFNTVAGQSLRPMGKGSWQSADVRNNSGLKSLEAIGSSCMRACAAGPGACNDAGHWKLALAILSSLLVAEHP